MQDKEIDLTFTGILRSPFYHFNKALIAKVDIENRGDGRVEIWREDAPRDIVTVYRHWSYRDKSFEPATVNWSAMGSVDGASAKRYGFLLTTAADIASRLDRGEIDRRSTKHGEFIFLTDGPNGWRIKEEVAR